MALLEVNSLTAGYTGGAAVVRGLSFRLDEGETLGLCGASGCGKTTIIWAILGMLDKYGGYASGEILYRGKNLLTIPENDWQPIRWKGLSLVPQSSMSALNPVYTVRHTFTETLKAHKAYAEESNIMFEQLMEMVGLGAETLTRYPHELSGGMRQRVSIALAILLNPEVLILDEATTGLDVVVEADILKLLRELQKQQSFGMIFVSHDRRITGEFCDRRIEL